MPKQKSTKYAKRFANLIALDPDKLDEQKVAGIIGCSAAKARQMLENCERAGILEGRMELRMVKASKETEEDA